MTYSNRMHRRLAAGLAALAACAILTSGAGAMILDRDQHHGAAADTATYDATYGVGATFLDMLDSKGLTTSSYFAHGVGATAADYPGAIVGPETPLTVPIAAPESVAVSVLPDDRAARPTLPVATTEPAPAAGTFDWSDAGIGIALGMLAGIALGAALLMGRRRRGTLQGA
jgi:hypothetical protein